MSPSLGRSSSHAPSRPPSSQPSSSQQREHSLSLQISHDGPKVSRKRRSDHGRSEEDSKRRRQDGGFLAAEELLKPSIVVRVHPPNPMSRPCTLLPLMLLPREHLPLSCLDLSAPNGDLPSSRQFQSHIRIMELEGRLGSNILIARSPSSNSGGAGGFSSVSSLFAIERDEAGLYVLCKLGSWVDIRKLSQFATAVCQPRMPASTQVAANETEPALITPQVYKERGKKRLAIAELQSIVRRRPTSQLAAEASAAASQCDEAQSAVLQQAPDALEPVQDTHSGINDLPARPPGQTLPLDKSASSKTVPFPTPPASDATKASSTPHMEPPEHTNTPTADDIFQNIRNQYFEALYHSLGSLAYFAKGPLSRARAAFHLDCDSNLEMDDLIDFLKGLVLATAIIDKKFRETVPEVVARLRTLGDVTDHAEPKKRSKKVKKAKLGSGGLYSDEEAHVRKWWETNKPAPRDDEVFPRPEEIKYTISCLRTRETQLQMILILEILALETMRPAGDAVESQLPGIVLEALTATPAKKEPSKKRNKHNLPLLIDVHADRLCIWQSTISDDVRALAESQVRPSGEHSSSQSAHSDSLKDFCVDIIVPFFSPRLPLLCDSLNHKLGGPVIAPSTSRSKTTSSAVKSPMDAKAREKPSSSKQQRSKPGAATRRPSASTSSARNLERILSNERLRRSVSRGPNDAIAQMRSTTAAPIPGLKREISEPMSLANIPRRASSTSLKERPTGMARSSSDVVSNHSSKPEDPRARKKALVEAELQEAISALKKPNRELAGKAVVEAAEKRLFGVSGHARKSKKPNRLAAPGDPVQVKATPVNNRFRDVFANTTAEFHVGSVGDGGGHPNYSKHHQDLYQPPTNRELLFPARSQQDFLAASPRVVATPAVGRIQATPVRSVPDSAIRLATTASTTTLSATTAATAAMTSKFTISRSSLLHSFPEEEESVLMSSPAAARRVAPTLVQGGSRRSDMSGSGDSMHVFRRLNENKAFFDSGMVPASSPLQARSQPPITVSTAGREQSPLFTIPTQTQSVIEDTPPSPSIVAGGSRRAALFETPTKVRSMPREDAVAKSIMATPLMARPAAPGGGNSVQALYHQMGWDDDLDDLA